MKRLDKIGPFFTFANHDYQVDTSLKALEQSEDAGVLGQYAQPLRDMTLIRLLKQVAQVCCIGKNNVYTEQFG